MELNEKQKKVANYLVEKEGYEKSDTDSMLRKYGMDNVELVFESPQKGKLDFELEVDESGLITFFIRVDNYIERKFKEFYRNANEVKKALKERQEIYLEELSEVGFKEYFKQEAERLFRDDKQLKQVALWMAEGKIDIHDYSEGQTRQIEGALLAGMDGYRVSKKRFDDIKQEDFANYQEYQNHLQELESKKKRLVSLQRNIEADWKELKNRQWSEMWTWLKSEEQEKRVKKMLRDGKIKEEVAKELTKEFFNSLPKTTQVKLEDIENCISGEVRGWESELLTDDMKNWTDKQWKQYLPKEDYSPYDYDRKRYNNAKIMKLQLKKIDKRETNDYYYNSYKHENDFYQQIVENKPESFNPEKMSEKCYFCYLRTNREPAPFKLILKTKLRLIYTCSRCENSEIFFDILEWEKNAKREV